MRNPFLILFSLCVFFQAQAQNTSGGGTVTESNDSMGVFMYSGVMPSFQGGGENAFIEYIKTNLIYPKDAKASGIQGTVYVQYIIEKDGSVSNVSIVPEKGVHPLLDYAAMDVIKSSPNWIPGSTNGKPVRVKKIQRINFALQNK
jgi:protein TonB